MRCKTKQRKGSRSDLILGYRRITVPRLRDGRSFRDCGTGEMNDHPPSTLLARRWANRIRLIAIETMKGAFGNGGALRSFKRPRDAGWTFCAGAAGLFPPMRRL